MVSWSSSFLYKFPCKSQSIKAEFCNLVFKETKLNSKASNLSHVKAQIAIAKILQAILNSNNNSFMTKMTIIWFGGGGR